MIFKNVFKVLVLLFFANATSKDYVGSWTLNNFQDRNLINRKDIADEKSIAEIVGLKTDYYLPIQCMPVICVAGNYMPCRRIIVYYPIDLDTSFSDMQVIKFNLNNDTYTLDSEIREIR